MLVVYGLIFFSSLLLSKYRETIVVHELSQQYDVVYKGKNNLAFHLDCPTRPLVFSDYERQLVYYCSATREKLNNDNTKIIYNPSFMQLVKERLF